MTDGFIARLIVVEAKERPARQDAAPLLVTPSSLIAHIKKAREDLPRPAAGNLRTVGMALDRPALHTVPWEDEEAERRWLAVEDWQYEQIEEHGAHDGLIGRTAEHVVKLATVRAISRKPAAPAVSVDDVEWAYALVQRSIDSLENGAREHMAGSQFEELCKAIMRELRAAPKGEIAQSQLVRRRGISKADDRMVKAALDRLTVAGDIYPPEAASRGLRIRIKTEEAA